MKVCFLSSAHTPRDKRIFYKEAVSLAQAGYEVVHLAPDEDGSVEENGIRILTYCSRQGIAGRLLQIPRLYKLAGRIRADCYHCNEVDSWFIGVLLKLVYRSKVVFDVHEHYPGTFAESRFPIWLRPFVGTAVRYGFRLLLPFTDRVVLAKQSVAIDFAGFENRLVLVRNFVPLSAVERDLQIKKKVNRSDSPVVAIHLGLMSRIRGWPQLLQAMFLISSKRVHICIIGTFNDGSQSDFQMQVEAQGLQEQVRLEDWMPFEQAFREMSLSDIGLVLFQPGISNHEYALPHKMFDYMLAGLPVIAPRFAQEVAPIIQEADCGILVDTSNPSDIAQALRRLIDDPEERERLGENGRRAVITRYNWESEAVRLLEMYQELQGEQG